MPFFPYALILWKQIKVIKPGASVPFKICLDTSAQVKSYGMWLGCQKQFLACLFECWQQGDSHAFLGMKFKTQVKLSIAELAIPFGLITSNLSCSPFLMPSSYHFHIWYLFFIISSRYFFKTCFIITTQRAETRKRAKEH